MARLARFLLAHIALRRRCGSDAVRFVCLREYVLLNEDRDGKSQTVAHHLDMQRIAVCFAVHGDSLDAELPGRSYNPTGNLSTTSRPYSSRDQKRDVLQ
jgi:hypothetical protein